MIMDRSRSRRSYSRSYSRSRSRSRSNSRHSRSRSRRERSPSYPGYIRHGRYRSQSRASKRYHREDSYDRYRSDDSSSSRSSSRNRSKSDRYTDQFHVYKSYQRNYIVFFIKYVIILTMQLFFCCCFLAPPPFLNVCVVGCPKSRDFLLHVFLFILCLFWHFLVFSGVLVPLREGEQTTILIAVPLEDLGVYHHKLLVLQWICRTYCLKILCCGSRKWILVQWCHPIWCNLCLIWWILGYLSFGLSIPICILFCYL